MACAEHLIISKGYANHCSKGRVEFSEYVTPKERGRGVQHKKINKIKRQGKSHLKDVAIY